MKKLFLLLTIGVMTSEANAQSALTLTGSSYTQNFDGLASGLPAGWHLYTSATNASLGTLWDASSTKWLKTPNTTGTSAEKTDWTSITGNFRNVASANGNTSAFAADTVGQVSYANRALGIRQVGKTNANFPNSDSGAVFALKLANTVHRGGFELTFKLQSLDATSPRVTTWAVDYGFGDNPTTFTTATATGTMTTGGSAFSNNTITVDFGTALDSVSTPVWIRIAALDISSGSGNRATTAIDDVELTFTPNAAASVANVNNNTLSFFVAGTATANNIMLGGLENGKYAVSIVDMVGRTVYNNNAIVSGQQVSINDANLQSGLYMMKVSNGQRTGIMKVSVQ